MYRTSYPLSSLSSLNGGAYTCYWVEKSAGLAMPFRRQIEPIEIPGILPIALLADVTPSGARMRLLGTEATNAYGSETRNCLVADIQLGEFTVSWQDAFLRACTVAIISDSQITPPDQAKASRGTLTAWPAKSPAL